MRERRTLVTRPAASRARRAAAVTVIAGACLSAPLAAQMLVIQSASTRYHAGQQLPAAAELQLGPGESVRLIRAGVTRRLCGPGRFRFEMSSSATGCRTGSPDGGRVGGIGSSDIARADRGFLVMRAAGPSAGRYRPGLRVERNLTLRAGDSVTILLPRGPRIFTGPATIDLTNPGPPRPSAMSAAPGRVGYAMRPPPALPPDIWLVDASRGGTVCARPDQAPTFWRRGGTATTVTISGPDGETRTVDWPANETSLAWPADLPFAPGRYELRIGSRPISLDAVVVTDAPELEDVAEQLASSGCTAQVETLIGLTQAATAPGDASADDR